MTNPKVLELAEKDLRAQAETVGLGLDGWASSRFDLAVLLQAYGELKDGKEGKFYYDNDRFWTCVQLQKQRLLGNVLIDEGE